MSNHLKKFAKITSYLLLFVIIAGLIFYFGKDIFVQFKKVNSYLLFISIILQIPMIACGGLAFKVLCQTLGIHIKFHDWVGLSFIANLLNQLLPYRPGVGFRYIYMRQHYKMKTSDFFHVMFIYFLLTLLLSSAFTLLGLFDAKIPNIYNLCALAVFLIFAIFLMFFLIKRYFPSLQSNASKPSVFSKLTVALHTLLNSPGALIGATLSLFTLNALTAIIFYVIFMSLGNPLPFTDCLFMIGVVLLTMIVPITPGNIGVLETITGTLTQMLYQDFSLGFSATALFRISQWIPSVLLGTGFSIALCGSMLPKFSYKLGAKHSVD
ncbi:MAG: YbhN family protein [Candidatus Berkiella sp.]